MMPAAGMDTSTPSKQWASWQLLDSMLPTGGFAHSQGLEAASQSGWVTDNVESVEAFCKLSLHNQASLMFPYVEACRIHTADAIMRNLCQAENAVTSLTEIDKRLHCQLSGNDVARRASMALGCALLRASIAAFGEDTPEASAILKGLKKASRLNLDKGGTPAHQGCVFGTVVGMLGFSAPEARRMYLYLHLRDTVSAATRLNLVGPMEAAKMQRKLGLVAEDLAVHHELWQDQSSKDSHQARSADTNMFEAANGAPVLELLQASHDCMYSRLFSS